MYDPEPALHDRLEMALDGEACRSADHVEAIEVHNQQGQAPVLIIADHAGRHIPAYLDNLGLPEEERRRHIAFDIGTADIARRLAKHLDAPAVLNHVSRLVIDPNRSPGSPTSIPKISDGTVIPGNQHVDAEEARERIRLSFLPYHRAISRQIARLRRRVGVPVIISIHSFTPRMQKAWRPWEVGVLWADDKRLAAPVIQGLSEDTQLCVGDNQPYSGDHPDSYSLLFHAKRTGLPNVAFEVRQDLIDTKDRAEAWADRLSRVLQPALSDPTLYRTWGSWRRIADDDCPAVADARG